MRVMATGEGGGSGNQREGSCLTTHRSCDSGRERVRNWHETDRECERFRKRKECRPEPREAKCIEECIRGALTLRCPCPVNDFPQRGRHDTRGSDSNSRHSDLSTTADLPGSKKSSSRSPAETFGTVSCTLAPLKHTRRDRRSG